MQSDPYSLDRLHDIVELPPVSWWPPAAFWFCLGSLAAVWLVYAVLIAGHRWIGNAYRRQALRELTWLQQSEPVAPKAEVWAELSGLLKRVALVSFPRERVASLSGDRWLQFLSETSDDVDFTQPPASVLGSGSSDSRAVPESGEDFGVVVEMARTWIVTHRAEAQS